MKMIKVALITMVLLATSPVMAAEITAHDEQRQAPERAMPHPPRSTLRFALVKGKKRQSLEVIYVDSRTIAFKLKMSGACNRKEHGRATITKNWRLGAETDENEAGEAIAVQEYIYSKSGKCTISFRIDEGDWAQATMQETAECSPDCHLLAESMPMRK